MSAATATASHRWRCSPAARSAGRSCSPTSARLTCSDALRRETFLLRGRTLADFINKTKTEKWKALVEILGLDAIESLQRRPAASEKRLAQGIENRGRRSPRVPPCFVSGRRHGDRGNRSHQSSADLRDAGCRSTAIVGSSCRAVVDHGSGWRQRQRLRFVRSREPPGGNQSARSSGVRQEARSRRGIRWWHRTGRACCRVHRWCVKRSGCSRRGRSKRDAARSADRKSTRKRWREGSRARSSR